MNVHELLHELNHPLNTLAELATSHYYLDNKLENHENTEPITYHQEQDEPALQDMVVEETVPT